MLINKRISVFYFLRIIKWDLLAIVVYAIVIGTLDHFSFFKQISVPLAVSSLLGTLLSLLLAFRTSQSYERWWEARIVWGGIVNDSRTLIRQLLEFFPKSDKKADFIKKVATRQAIWCYSLGESLRRLPVSEKVQRYCSDNNIHGENIPNLLLTKHAEDVAELSEAFNLNANKIVQLDSTIQRLTDSMGKCERIKNTVFPRSYSVLIHFLIYALMTILPFGLDDNNPIVEIFLVTFIPSLFIAIEQTAILMQDPFENKPNDTAMTSLAGTIERNMMEMIGETPPPKTEPSPSYYVL